MDFSSVSVIEPSDIHIARLGGDHSHGTNLIAYKVEKHIPKLKLREKITLVTSYLQSTFGELISQPTWTINSITSFVKFQKIVHSLTFTKWIYEVLPKNEAE